jgi:hypothetical protein
MVVLFDVFHKFILEILDRCKGLVIEELGFEHTKNVLDHRAVVTIPFSGYVWPDPFLPECLLIQRHLVVPSQVRMKNQRTIVGMV